MRFGFAISKDKYSGARTNVRLACFIACVALALVIIPTAAHAGDVKLAWDANTDSDLAGYKVYYGTASGTYQSNIDVGNVTSYTVTGLGDGLLYFFAVTAYGTSSGESGYSNEVSTTVIGVPDTTAPLVSAVAVPVITFSGATITWTTDELSNSQVEYGLTTAYGSTSPLDTSLLLAHSVTLGGLSGNTVYHFRVRSSDAAGNLAVSGDFTFTTLAEDVLPADLIAAYAYNEGTGTIAADVSANNNTAALSGATWSTSCRFGNCLSFNGTSNFVESPDIDALTPGTGATFEAWVVLPAAPSETASVFNKWNQSTDDEYLFGISSSQTLYFAWQTTGGRTWGTASFNHVFGLGTIPLNTLTHIAVVRSSATLQFYINGNLDSAHVVMDTNPFRNGINTLRIGGQGRGATRFFSGRIDEPRMYNRALTQAEIQYDMNTAISSPATDTAPPVISSVATSLTTTSGTTISWTTNEAADTQVEYGLTTTYGSSTTLDTTLLTAHSVNIAGLAEATLYHFRVKSRDAAANLAVSADFTFSTIDGTAPSVSITDPTGGAMVSGAVTVTASAADNVGVTQVQILVDGVPIATDTSAPYTTSWDSSTVANGSHTLTAVAQDLAGNSMTSAPVAVTVANDDETVIGLGEYPADGGWLALGGKTTNAFTTQVWSRIGWDAYWASNGELHTAAGDLDGDGLDEIVIGFGAGGNGWIAILDDPAHGYQWIRWLQVAWPSYNSANGAVFPAVGDIDGDGRAEIVAGLGTGSGGFVEIFDDAAAGYAHVRWLQVNWAEYNSASGETHPAVADLDGDGRAEIVLGLGTGGKGFVEIRGGAPNYEHRAWLEVLLPEYNQLNGATFPAAGDLDNDGRAEIVVGLGEGSAGWIEVFDDAAASHRHLRWVQVAWPEYNAASGETHPAVGNLDEDAAAEIVIGLGKFTGGPGGWFEIVDDANTGTGYELRRWQQIGRDTFEQSGGATYPSIAQQRR
jgi:hypothetical protein